MDFVVDSSVFVKWLVPEAHSEKATAFVERLARRDVHAFSPDLVSAEVGHALRSYFPLSACRTRDRSRSSVLDVTNSALWIARARGGSSTGSMRTRF